MPDRHRRWPVELYSKTIEVPEPPPADRRSYWDAVAQSWLDEQLQKLTSDGPKKAQVRHSPHGPILGTAERDHQNFSTY